MKSKALGSTAVKGKQQGFTIIELLVAVAIFAILAGIGVPSFVDYMANSRLTASTNELVAAMQYTRSESIRRNARVAICPSTDGASCSGANAWEAGWIIYTDANNNAMPDMPADIIRVQSALDGQLTISGNGSIDSYISFTGRGAPQTMGGATQSGTLSVCDDMGDGNSGRAIQLSASGRLKTTNDPADFSCVVIPS